METKLRWSRFGEFLILYIGMPLVFYFDWIPLPKIVSLLLAAGLFVAILWYDSSFKLRHLLHYEPDKAPWINIVNRTLMAALAAFTLVMLYNPDMLLAFPLEKPLVWLVVLLLYPLLSALPQELIYREFLFHRYKVLTNSDFQMMMLSALSFSLLHIIYDNFWAIWLSFLAGLLLSDTYRKTKSLYVVAVEHALYGIVVFTLGLGDFFYEPF